jgi:hypothetical protein
MYRALGAAGVVPWLPGLLGLLRVPLVLILQWRYSYVLISRVTTTCVPYGSVDGRRPEPERAGIKQEVPPTVFILKTAVKGDQNGAGAQKRTGF